MTAKIEPKKTQRLTEKVQAAFTESKVDREGGKITNVLVCGTESLNGREYPVEVLRRDHAKYEGRLVNCDHSRESTVDRRFGWFSDVKPGSDGKPRGTLNVLKSHPMYERVMEAAERNPAMFGFSHVAMCETRVGRDGREVIEAIKSVESIDLVADPATTKGLFESRETKVPITIKALAESVTRDPKATTEQILKIKKLAEAEGGVSMDSPGEGTDPKEAISAGFKAAILAVVESAMSGGDPKDAIAKIKKLLTSHNDATAEPEPTPAAGAGDADPDKKPESRKPAADPYAVLEECRKQNVTPSSAELKVIAQMEAVDRAAWIMDQRAKVQAETPRSGGSVRTGATTRKAEGKGNGPEVKDVKSFLEAISV